MKLEKCDNYLKDIKNLYENAFPENERYEFNFLLNGRYPNYELFAVINENVFVGFVYVTVFENIAYIVYLAISEKFRNCGYGSVALKLIKEKYKKYDIMLSIEKPVSEMQKRRLKFYQKNDFFKTDFELISKNVDFQVMCYGKYNYESLLRFFKLNFPNAIIK